MDANNKKIFPMMKTKEWLSKVKIILNKEKMIHNIQDI